MGKLAIDVFFDVPPLARQWDFRTPGAKEGYATEDGHGIVTLPRALAQNVVIRWNFPYNIAIDDIKYTVTSVPEPATLVSWVLGLAGLGLVGYRRHRRRLA